MAAGELHFNPRVESGLADDINKRKRVERQILLYLQEHPSAADSAEGIRHWWLRDMGELSQATVNDALGELLRRGWLTTRVTAQENTIIALNPNEAGSVARYLAEEGGDG